MVPQKLTYIKVISTYQISEKVYALIVILSFLTSIVWNLPFYRCYTQYSGGESPCCRASEAASALHASSNPRRPCAASYPITRPPIHLVDRSVSEVSAETSGGASRGDRCQHHQHGVQVTYRWVNFIIR